MQIITVAILRYFFPTIDKPARVYDTLAILIYNIFLNIPENVTCSGNVTSDVSDHFTQFCIMSYVRSYFQPKLVEWPGYET